MLLLSQDILMATPKLEVQIVLALLHSFIWYVLINHVIWSISYKVIHNMKSKKRFLYHTRQTTKKLVGYDPGDNEDSQLDFAAQIQGVLLQHAIGGFLCLPSLLGLSTFLPTGVTSAMARQGALSEVGYEIEDTLLRLWQIIFGGETLL